MGVGGAERSSALAMRAAVHRESGMGVGGAERSSALAMRADSACRLATRELSKRLPLLGVLLVVARLDARVDAPEGLVGAGERLVSDVLRSSRLPLLGVLLVDAPEGLVGADGRLVFGVLRGGLSRHAPVFWCSSLAMRRRSFCVVAAWSAMTARNSSRCFACTAFT